MNWKVFKCVSERKAFCSSHILRFKGGKQKHYLIKCFLHVQQPAALLHLQLRLERKCNRIQIPKRHRPNLSTWWNLRVIRFEVLFFVCVQFLSGGGGADMRWTDWTRSTFFFLTDSFKQGCSFMEAWRLEGLILRHDSPQRRKNEVLCGPEDAWLDLWLW